MHTHTHTHPHTHTTTGALELAKSLPSHARPRIERDQVFLGKTKKGSSCEESRPKLDHARTHDDTIQKSQ